MSANTNVKVIISAQDNASSTLKSFDKKLSTLGKSAKNLSSDLKLVGVATVSMATGLVALAIKAGMSAARVTELGFALNAIAKANNISQDAVDGTVKSLRGMNIAHNKALQITSLFIQSQLDLADATKIATAAKDLAVVAGLDSSEATETLTNAIVMQRPMLLKQFGIVKGLDQIYDDYKQTVSGVTGELDEAQKKQAMVNAVLEAGKRTAGAYDAAMGSVSKQFRSLTGRIIPDFTAQIGKAFEPALVVVISAISGVIKDMSWWVSENGATIEAWGNQIAMAVSIGVDAIGQLVTFLVNNKELVIGFFTALAYTVGVMVASFVMAHAVAIATIAGITLAVAGLIKIWGSLNDKIGDVVTTIQGKFGPLVEFIQSKVDRIKQIFEGFGVSGEMGGLITFFENLHEKIDWYTLRIVDILGGFYEKAKNFLAFGGMEGNASIVDTLEGIYNRIKPILDALDPLFQKIIENFKLTGEIIKTQIKPAFDALMEVLGPFVDAVGPVIGEQLMNLMTAIATAIGLVIAAVLGVITGLVNGIANAMPYIAQSIEGIIQFFRGMVQFITALFEGDLKGAFEGLKQMLAGLVDFFDNSLTAVIKFVKGFVEGVVSFFQALYNTLVGNSIVPDLVNAIVNSFTWMVDTVINWISDLYNAVVEKFNAIKEKVDGVISYIKNLINNFRPTIKIGLDLPNLEEAWGGLKDRAHNLGIPGFATGGVVPGPIGQPALAMVHGGEQINPVGRTGGDSGAGVSLTVQIGLYAGTETEKRNIAEELYISLKQIAASQNKSISELLGE